MSTASFSYGFIRKGRTIRHFETVENESYGFEYKVFEFEPGEESEEVFVCGPQTYDTEVLAAGAMREKMQEFVSQGWENA